MARPAGPSTPADLATAKLTQEALAEEMPRVQKSAQGWATALTGMTGLIATLTVVKGESTVEDLTEGAKVAVAIFVVAAIALGVWAAYCAAQAANGMPTTIEPGKLAKSRHEAASNARGWLEFAIRTTVLAIVCAIVAVLVAWFGVADSTKPSLKIVSEGTTYCASVKSSGGGSVTLKDGSIETPIELNSVEAIDAVSSCD